MLCTSIVGEAKLGIRGTRNSTLIYRYDIVLVFIYYSAVFILLCFSYIHGMLFTP